MPKLAPKEIFLLHELSKNHGFVSQRELAQRAGISIGLINILLKNLIRQGYVKTKNLNKRKIRYFLTQKGFKQNLNRCYQTIRKTIWHYQQLECSINSTIEKNIREGYRHFRIVGDGELATLVEKIVRGFGDKATLLGESDMDGSLLAISINVNGAPVKKTGQMMNLMEHLDKTYL